MSLLAIASLFSCASAFMASMPRPSGCTLSEATYVARHRRPDRPTAALPDLRSGSPLQSVISDDTRRKGNDADTSLNNPLKSAGLSFVSASSKSLGMLFYNIGGMDHKDIQALLLEAGTSLVVAGEAWSADWNVVREGMSSASKAFHDISNVFGSANIDESMPLGILFEKIGKEMEDMSEIGGCCALGPQCSVPNLLAVEGHLTEVSKILKKNSVAATDEHMMCTLFREVAGLFGEMAARYIDDDK